MEFLLEMLCFGCRGIFETLGNKFHYRPMHSKFRLTPPPAPGFTPTRETGIEQTIATYALCICVAHKNNFYYLLKKNMAFGGGLEKKF